MVQFTFSTCILLFLDKHFIFNEFSQLELARNLPYPFPCMLQDLRFALDKLEHRIEKYRKKEKFFRDSPKFSTEYIETMLWIVQAPNSTHLEGAYKRFQFKRKGKILFLCQVNLFECLRASPGNKTYWRCSFIVGIFSRNEISFQVMEFYLYAIWSHIVRNKRCEHAIHLGKYILHWSLCSMFM